MAREVDLIQYLPPVVHGFREFQETAKTENAELGQLFSEAEDRLSDSFIQEASMQGIRHYEQMLHLPSDRGLSLEDRRKRILIKWNRQLPYTLRRLVEQLALWTDGGNFWVDTSGFLQYQIGIYVLEQTLSVLRNIKAMSREMIPANILLDFFGEYQARYKVPVVYENKVHFQVSFYPRFNQAYLYLDRSWKLDGGQFLNGYDSGTLLDFYPVGLRIQTEAREMIKEALDLRIPLTAAETMRAEISVGIRAGAMETAASKERVRIRALASEAIQIRESARLSLSAAEVPNTGSRVNYQSMARVDPDQAERVEIRTGAAEEARTEDIRVLVMNQMDQTWKLDSSRKLNGGLSIL